MLENGPEALFRNKTGAEAGEGLRRANDQIDVCFQDIGNLVQEFFSVLQGAINSHISAEDNIKRAQADKGLYQIHFTEADHGAELVLNLPGLTGQGKIFGQLIRKTPCIISSLFDRHANFPLSTIVFVLDRKTKATRDPGVMNVGQTTR